MMSHLRDITIFFLVMAIYGATIAEEAQICNDAEAINAEREASTLEDWSSIHRSYKMFGHCDDASIAEGYSSSIARLLSTDWQNFGKLNQLMRRNKQFENFIFKHIDETWSPDEVALVTENAKFRCPLKALVFCNRLIKTIDKASK